MEASSRALYQTLASVWPALPPPSDLRTLAIEKRAGVWFVILQQTARGVPVDGARFDCRYTSDGKLLFFTQSLELDLDPSEAPLLALEDADARAIESLVEAGADPGALSARTDLSPLAPARDEAASRVLAGPDRSTHLTWMKGRPPRLVYVARTELRLPPARFVSWIDARTGEVLQRENEYRYLDFLGHADGSVQLELPTDPFVTEDFVDLRIVVQGLGSTYSDALGDWAMAAPNSQPRQVTADLSGRWARVVDATGAQPHFLAFATPGTPVPVTWDNTNSDPAERDTYYHLNIIHDWVKGTDPGFAGVDYEMLARVNIAQTCNAFWDGAAVNFFKAGGGCTNTGQIADIIYHEYGHAVNQFTFAPADPTSSEDEGFADYHAATITNQSLIGRGMNGPGTHIRDCDNDRVFPAPECNGEGHCEGEVIAGALWHMREALVTRLGQQAGVELADHLFRAALYGRQTTYLGYFYDLLAVDDDNGTLLDGTPHAAEILPAFARHGIGPGYVLDIAHTPLLDSESPDVPRRVVAVFSCPADLLVDSLAVYYSSEPSGSAAASGPTRLALSPTGATREYEAFIPGQPTGTDVSYWIEGEADTLGLAATAPTGAPANQFTYHIGADITPPSILFEPLRDQPAALWPPPASAEVSDNLGVALVALDWEINGASQPSIELIRQGQDPTYSGDFGGVVSEGNVITYRIRAVDSASSPNTAFDPPVGSHTFTVVHTWKIIGEYGIEGMTHYPENSYHFDQWHLSSERNHTPGGATAWKFGDTNWGPYLDRADGSLVTPSFQFETGAYMTFWFWIQAEVDNDHVHAWDGALVELTTDNGESWSLLTPQGGYTHIMWENPDGPFPGGTPCWSGSQGWIHASFDLAYLAFESVRVRFRFGSDAFLGLAGWYVDDIELDPGHPVGDAPTPEGHVLPTMVTWVGPNPSQADIRVDYQLGAASPLRFEVYDPSGRRLRSFATKEVQVGTHSWIWDGRNDQGAATGAGVYLIRVHLGDATVTRKVIRVR